MCEIVVEVSETASDSLCPIPPFAADADNDEDYAAFLVLAPVAAVVVDFVSRNNFVCAYSMHSDRCTEYHSSRTKISNLFPIKKFDFLYSNHV